MKNIPSLPRVTEEEFNQMTDEQKRIYLLQIKQEETMEWQLQASKLYSISFYIILCVVGFCLLYNLTSITEKFF